MTDASPAAPGGGPSRGLPGAGALLVTLAVGHAALLFYGAGPDLAGEAGGLLAPRGFLRSFLGGLGSTGAMALVASVGALLAACAVAATSSAVGRWLALSAAVAAACFTYYGVVFPLPWRFFGGHWSAAMVTFAAVSGAALASVWLAARWSEHPGLVRALLYAPLFLAVVALERNVTGTDPSLPFAISPWPAVTVFGLGVVAYSATAVLLGAAGGLAVGARVSEGGRRLQAALCGAALGLGVPWLVLALGSYLELLPFEAGRATYGAVGTVSVALLGIAALAPGRAAPGTARAAVRARSFGLAALLLGLPLVTGQGLARLDYQVTRDDRAQRVIDALEAHFAEEQLYPDSLEELVEAGHLDSVPTPRIGFAALGQGAFTYQNFGTSFLLEFHATRWTQCAYNPPYDEEDLFDEEDELGGVWSCPSKPPELW